MPAKPKNKKDPTAAPEMARAMLSRIGKAKAGKSSDAVIRVKVLTTPKKETPIAKPPPKPSKGGKHEPKPFNPAIPMANSRHERFAIEIAKGKATGVEAYMVTATMEEGRPTRKPANGDYVMASKWLSDVNIQARVLFLQKAAASSAVMDMAERRKFLARVVRLNMTSIDTEKDGDLIQEVVIRPTEHGTERKYKLPGKRECIMDDAKLAGDLVEKVEHSGEIKTITITEKEREKVRDKRRAAIERQKAGK